MTDLPIRKIPKRFVDPFLKKDIIISFRLSKNDLIKLNLIIKDCQLDRSEYIYRSIFGQPLTYKIDLKSLTQIKKIGANLNQITNVINYKPEAIHLNDCMPVLNDIKNLINDLIQKL